VKHPVIADRKPKPSRGEWPLTAVLVLAVLARLGFATLVYARPELAVANDTDRYVPMAKAILSRQAYGWNTDHPRELLNTIGYPLFLAGVFALLGEEAGDVALAQLLMTGASALVLYFWLSRWMRATPVFLAAALLLIDPLTILWSMTVLTEALFAVTLGIGAALLVTWVRSRGRIALVLAGVCCGLACLVKPLAMLIIAIWTAGLLFFPWEGSSTRERLKSGVQLGLLFVLPSVMLIVPWFVRNAILWDCPTLSSVDRVTMRDYMAAKVLAEAEHLELGQAQQRLQEDDPGVCPDQTVEYWKIILSRPDIYARLHAAGTIPVLFGTNFDRWLQYTGTDYTMPDLWRPYMDGGWKALVSAIGMELRDFPQGLGLMVALTLFQVVVYALGALGAIASLRLPAKAVRWSTIMLILAILILVLTPGQGGHERFRVPVQPLLAILIAHGTLWRSRTASATVEASL
jgi:hypothetical protein